MSARSTSTGGSGWPASWTEAGIGYVRYDNSLLAIDDLEAASALCEHFAHRAWPRVLNAFARRMNPMLAGDRRRRLRRLLLGAGPGRDRHRRHVQDPPGLLEIWPDLVRHAALNMSSDDVLGFLGRKLHPSLTAQVVTDDQTSTRGVAGPASHGAATG